MNMIVEYQLVTKAQITDQIREMFATALGQQGKVQGDLLRKADRCKLMCIATAHGEVVGIGALKSKTASDFSEEKAALPELSAEFEWELGYVFTVPAYAGQGIARNVCRTLVEAHGNGNLMASTEVLANPAMVKILESLGFRLYGKRWKSAIHGEQLGLYLRYVE